MDDKNSQKNQTEIKKLAIVLASLILPAVAIDENQNHERFLELCTNFISNLKFSINLVIKKAIS